MSNWIIACSHSVADCCRLSLHKCLLSFLVLLLLLLGFGNTVDLSIVLIKHFLEVSFIVSSQIDLIGSLLLTLFGGFLDCTKRIVLLVFSQRVLKEVLIPERKFTLDNEDIIAIVFNP